MSFHIPPYRSNVPIIQAQATVPDFYYLFLGPSGILAPKDL